MASDSAALDEEQSEVVEWRDVVAYEDFYSVSDDGRVFSKPRTVARKDGTSNRIGSKELRAFCNPKGYLDVVLAKESKTKHFLVHRLVANAFIPNPENKPHVNHKDGNKLNNCIDNLEWCTIAENNKHAWAMGFNKRIHTIVGERHQNSKLTNQQVLEIVKDSRLCSQIADDYNVHRGTIEAILYGRSWSKITGLPRIHNAKRRRKIVEQNQEHLDEK